MIQDALVYANVATLSLNLLFCDSCLCDPLALSLKLKNSPQLLHREMLQVISSPSPLPRKGVMRLIPNHLIYIIREMKVLLSLTGKTENTENTILIHVINSGGFIV